MNEIDDFFKNREATTAEILRKESEERAAYQLKLLKFVLPTRLEYEIATKNASYRWVDDGSKRTATWPLMWYEYDLSSINLFQDEQLGRVRYDAKVWPREGKLIEYISVDELTPYEVAYIFENMCSVPMEIKGAEVGSLFAFTQQHWHRDWAARDRQAALDQWTPFLDD